MLDTLKLGIPLTQTQHKRVRSVAADSDRWQWVLFNEVRGEMLLRRISGLASTDQSSFHRELRWDIPPDYEPGCKLILEFSVPKYWYGHNIHLLYDFTSALKHLKCQLEKEFKLTGKYRFLDVDDWQVLRVDICYAWRMPTQRVAQQYLDGLKHLHFPRKRPTIYPTGIAFVGTTYSIKFYLKLPEFKTHDSKELKKGKASIEWINHLEAKAGGVLRVEATLRHKYLMRQGISVVSDLTQPLIQVEWHDEHPHNPKYSLWSFLETQEERGIALRDGMILTMPPVTLPTNPDNFRDLYHHSGGDFTYRKRDKLVAVLQYLLEKFVGTNTAMQNVDEVELKLMDVYKPVKAARLVSMWLYVQRFGTAKTKDIFGHNSYYVAKREMKKAGVSLIEPPSKVTTLDRDFIQRFRLDVPSEDVTNKFDDYRESDNVLNFVPKLSGSNL